MRLIVGGFVPGHTAAMLQKMATAAFVAIIMLGVALPASAQQTDNDYYASRSTQLLRTVEQYHLAQGEEKARQKNYESAFGDFSFILRFFPNHPRALLGIINLCLEWRSPHCTLDTVFDKAIEVRPDAPDTFVMIGIYLHRVKRYNDAVTAYERALKLDPNSINAHYNLGLTLVETRQYELANEHAQRAYALGATLPGLRRRLEKGGHWSTAAVEVDPNSTDANAQSSVPTTRPPASN